MPILYHMFTLLFFFYDFKIFFIKIVLYFNFLFANKEIDVIFIYIVVVSMVVDVTVWVVTAGVWAVGTDVVGTAVVGTVVVIAIDCVGSPVKFTFTEQFMQWT